MKDPDYGMRSGDIETLLEHKNAGRELVAADHESLPGREASGILFPPHGIAGWNGFFRIFALTALRQPLRRLTRKRTSRPAPLVLDILPKMDGWESDPPIGDVSWDACLKKNGRSVRIQVKMQRKLAGQPMLRRGFHVVEVQRTRTRRSKDGGDTRPYRFGEFDLLAVCMQASTGSWHSFMYIPSKSLTPKTLATDQIETLQSIPEFGDNGVWSTDLATALSRVG
jgi:hypothetical protein